MQNKNSMTSLNQLSRREKEVVKLLLAGKSNKLIASSLHIAESTVEFHLTNIYAKYQVGSRTELILKLGESRVAVNEDLVENRDRLNSIWRNWVTSFREAVSIIGKELKMSTVVENESSEMTFFESIRVCFIKFADFSGKATRPEFWWFMLFITLVASALTYLSEQLVNVFIIVTLLPLLAVGARRLRDIDKSPWWLLFLLVPVGGIVILGILWSQPPVNLLADDTPATAR
jgi:DNA-binding CsgD family transcriptional regulator